MTIRAVRAGIVVVALAILWGRPAVAQTADPAFEEDVKTLMEITGAAALGQQMATMVSGQILDAMKKAQPDIPDRAMVVAKETLDAEFATAFKGPDGIIAKTVTIYMRHFTHDDVRGLLVFYRTELGQKLIAKMPTLAKEGGEAGQAWMMANLGRITEALQARLKAEGLIK
jgi:hypothetical protein